jgi:hypothetical protein
MLKNDVSFHRALVTKFTSQNLKLLNIAICFDSSLPGKELNQYAPQ